MAAFLTSFVVIALAEMADKTQLLSLSLALRYRLRDVVMGVAFAIVVLNALAVGLGSAVGHLLPIGPVKIGAGVLFLVFGVWTLVARETPANEGSASASGRSGRSAALAVAGAFFVAELGDKTQLGALSLAARFESFTPVWLGATLGMLVANALAIGLGVLAGARLPQGWLKYASGALFIGFGIWTLVEAFGEIR